VSNDLVDEIPEGVVVERAFALDAARHMAIAGRYAQVTALPDRWSSWWPGGVLAGRRLIRQHRPAVIFATYPIATAHLIGSTLARWGGLPFVADYRDAMVVEDFPVGETLRRVYQRIEERIVREADAVTLTTPRARDLYRARYPAEDPEKIRCIRNGYDEADFGFLARNSPPRSAPSRVIRLLHSGLLKLTERDPRPFLQAVADLLNQGAISRKNLEIVFRAPGDELLHRRIIADFDLQDVVLVRPPVGYREAIEEMAAADVLLIFQDSGCNHLVPAKLYEYIRTGRPILALTDRAGETAELIAESGAGMVFDIASTDDIRAALPGFLRMVETGKAPAAPLEKARRYSRRSQAGELAAVFDAVSAIPERARPLV
jgi:glycosyltransferase involved in cell wall biosynthesis